MNKDIPIDDSFAVLDGKEEYYEGTDGVHPNAKGVEALAEVVSGTIFELLQDQKDILSMHCGLWFSAFSTL